MPSLSALYNVNTGIQNSETVLVSHTTASIANQSSASYAFVLANLAQLISITSDVDSRVILYGSNTGRSADTRVYNDTTSDEAFVNSTDLLFDVTLSAGTQDINNIFLVNRENPLNSTIYAKIFNLSGGTSTVTIDLVFVAFNQNNLGVTNLAFSNQTSTTADITSDTGTDATLTGATTSLAGLMVAADKTKLDTVETNADVTDTTNVVSSLNGATITSATVATGDKVLIQDIDDSDNLKTVTAQSIADLASGTSITVKDEGSNLTTSLASIDFTGAGVTASAIGNDVTVNISSGGTTNLAFSNQTSTTADITSDTGTDATLTGATGSLAGLMVAADKTKLDGIENNADVTDATNVVSSLNGATIPTATVATGDKVLIQDIDNSNNLKTVTTQSIANLMNVASSDTVAGIIELATQGEVDTGTDAVRAVTPATLTGRLPQKSYQNSNFNASANYTYLVDTSAGTVTATLPVSPTNYDRIAFKDADGTFSTYNLAINPNGKTIAGSSSNLTLTNNYESIDLIYSSDVDKWVIENSSVSNLIPKLSATVVVSLSNEISDLTTGTSVTTIRMPYAMIITEVRASVNTAPTGSTIIVDINQNGSSILSTKLSIDASEKTSTTAATPSVLSTTSLTDDAEITFDIDQVGSTIAGKGLKVYIIGVQA
jgi:hypothetical protein